MLYESEYYGICSFGPSLVHHGIKGQKWGVRNGPPYPLSAEKKSRVRMNRRNMEDAWRYSSGNITDEKLRSLKKENLNDLPRLPSNMSDEEKAEIRNEINRAENYETSGGRWYNCPNCAAAFEMTERGYAVRAKPKKNGSNVENIESFFVDGKLTSVNNYADYDDNIYDSYKKADRLWNKLTNAKFGFQKDLIRDKAFKAHNEYSEQVRNAKKKATDDTLAALNSQGNGARGIIVVGWEDKDDPSARTTLFHAFNYKVENGATKFYDVQSRSSDKQNGNVGYGFFWSADPREIYYMRTDTLQPSPKITDAVMSMSYRKRGTK